MSGSAPILTAQDESDRPLRWAGWLVATAQCVRFYSRLPVPRLPGEADPHAMPDFRVVPRALPFAAVIIAAPQAAIIAIAGFAGLPSLVTATLAITVAIVATGAFHEDGLADCADGFWGGATRERRLEIMRDSRVGTFGAAAVCVSIVLRVVALAAVMDSLGSGAASSLAIAVAALSRSAGLYPLWRLPPARMDGASAGVGRPMGSTLLAAVALSAVIAVGAACLADLPIWRMSFLCLASALAALAVARLARRKIAGQTGDVAGMAQQLAEMLCYVAVISFPAN
jgi:adenosylcobinamide-GDP ribazoletransferase